MENEMKMQNLSLETDKSYPKTQRLDAQPTGKWLSSKLMEILLRHKLNYAWTRKMPQIHSQKTFRINIDVDIYNKWAFLFEWSQNKKYVLVLNEV